MSLICDLCGDNITDGDLIVNDGENFHCQCWQDILEQEEREQQLDANKGPHKSNQDFICGKISGLKEIKILIERTLR